MKSKTSKLLKGNKEELGYWGTENNLKLTEKFKS